MTKADFFIPELADDFLKTYSGDKIFFTPLGDDKFQCNECNKKDISKDRRYMHVFYYHLPKPIFILENKGKLHCSKCDLSLKRLEWVGHCFSKHNTGSYQVEQESKKKTLLNMEQEIEKFNPNRPPRIVKLMYEIYDIYIDKKDQYFNRKFEDSIVKNPFREGFHETQESLKRYYKYFYEKLRDDPAFLQYVKELNGKVLGCWHVTNPHQRKIDKMECHGEIIIEFHRSFKVGYNPKDLCSQCNIFPKEFGNKYCSECKIKVFGEPIHNSLSVNKFVVEKNDITGNYLILQCPKCNKEYDRISGSAEAAFIRHYNSCSKLKHKKQKNVLSFIGGN